MPTYPIRRRPRECKTCLPCRASKVRCDRNVPCGNCVKRNFNCSYGRPPPKDPYPVPPAAPTITSTLSKPPYSDSLPSYTPPHQGTASGSRDVSYGTGTAADSVVDDQDPLSDTVRITQDEWDEINAKMRAMEQILGSLHSLFDMRRHGKPSEAARDAPRSHEASPRSEGIYEPDMLRTGSVHIGSRSALVDILNKSKGSEETAQALPKDDLLAELAMGNESAAYPFVDLWSSDPYTFNIAGVCGVLPDDEQCRRFLGFYRDIAAVLYPVLPDVAKLEQDMNRLMRNRKAAGGVYRPDANGLVKPFGMNLAFLSLLFAVLASGCQLSDLPGKERELTSWIYVSCAYHCLRMLNYVSQPTVEAIQILLIISHVLSYNMNAGASYTLLGMTERMCMVLGLHVESSGFPREIQAARRRVWWAMAFQNSHFSLAYDRPSITMISQPEIPYDPKSMPGHRSYFETLCRIVSVVLEMLRTRMYPHHSQLRYHEIREYKQRIGRIMAEGVPHLRSERNCTTLADHIERTELRLHMSYYLSVICRVSLDPDAHPDNERRAIIREDCLTSLMDTIEAFTELHSFSPHFSRTWISLQRTIASAFLLVANLEDRFRARAAHLIQKLEFVLADHVDANGQATPNSRTESAKNLASSLRALRQVSAALRAKEFPRPGSETTNTISNITTPLLVSASSPSVTIGTIDAHPYVAAPEDKNMRNILESVSDVMLFPSRGMAGL
ncbi:transcription factor domain protein [Aspergillus clavatus NRRL 1]|uniref:Fungal specific transcription factor domain protein n=1 Tax=Aspergillus clavatus (strain ATCC 1007 / CBS 513.65 / DSM 816 / NCTC 3887 / NRRL 1 / QM 1276 / 107) TaxID=344612 RepID=A1CSZ1_ASPCL|nr:fungal specific transcription factor domain protein [Aspergillus clavatus NRRL 1]EAW06428.1 fungal specific transcription factor domain protein [Aspergillus clavatus NRRL 1]